VTRELSQNSSGGEEPHNGPREGNAGRCDFSLKSVLEKGTAEERKKLPPKQKAV